MPRPQSGALGLHLERARDRVGGSRTAWCADYWWGECPALGWWWRVSQKSYIPSQPYEIAKNGEKTSGFAHVLAYNSRKTPFFAQRYFIRYTHETFFEELTNFEGYYLSRCRDIPLQSFGSHIRPQPHGLGLSVKPQILSNWGIQKVFLDKSFVCEILMFFFIQTAFSARFERKTRILTLKLRFLQV